MEGVPGIPRGGARAHAGVCNFLPEHLDRLHEETGEYPAVNQIELHPTWQQREVVDYCKAHGIAVEAYSPMARGADLNAGNGAIERIAAEHGVTPAQVILRWHIENGTIIIPKSVHADRQKQNLDLFGFVPPLKNMPRSTRLTVRRAPDMIR